MIDTPTRLFIGGAWVDAADGAAMPCGDLRRGVGHQPALVGEPAGLEARVGQGEGHGGQRDAVAVPAASRPHA
ncbi:hypothetical protein [Streptomyces sp. NBC_01538]|uniref:hypothetical protein n=1 Tax=Streptomyces sp. NBC_01538 TaxID=2903897 RepID=UPI0038687E2A